MASYRKICRAAAERLKEAGIEDAVYDARALLLHVTGMSFTDFLLRQDEEIPEESCENYVNLIRRRAMRIPLQHLTGTQWFYGLEFRINEHVLIPRPETELLVETALMYYRTGRKFFPDSNAVPIPDSNRCSSIPDTKPTGTPYAGTVSDFNICSSNQDMKANAAPYAVPASDPNDISPLQDIKTAAAPFEILDMCTGSGCILLSLLHELPDARGTGADISAEALEVARENARRLGIASDPADPTNPAEPTKSADSAIRTDSVVPVNLAGSADPKKPADSAEPTNPKEPLNPADSIDREDSTDQAGLAVSVNPKDHVYDALTAAADSIEGSKDRLIWLKSDMFEKVTGRYDLIVSNPPYIRRKEIETLSPEVRDHDPRAALDGGGDGLEFYRILASQSPGYLKEGARLILEIGADQASDVTALLQDAGFSDISVRQDLNGLDRVVCAGLTRKSGFDLF